MLKKSKYTVIGVMSGTSLDGIDIALCEIYNKRNLWDYKIIHATCVEYSADWRKRLSQAVFLGLSDRIVLDKEFGKLIGHTILKFCFQYNISKNAVDFISSHGHTIFHQPQKGITLQIGSGQQISDMTKLPVIYDFRSQDVNLGGQGAPLVPIGDELLFSDYNQCLNLGGFSNISMSVDEKRIAWDICPVNIVLNHLAEKLGKKYDSEGKLAIIGNPITELIEQLNQLAYYQLKAPKSLGREWVDEVVLPLINQFNYPVQDLLNSFVNHIANQIAPELNGKVLVTGGGAKNDFLIEQIRKKTCAVLEVPDELIVDFKEALVFAFLGVLRWEGCINILSSVTGAIHDHSSGKIVYPNS
jgi:anhydro-N-acetylmuramic acid kinase